MISYKFGVVILHYKTEKETINCAKSIMSLENSKNAIVLIVDNASGDDSLIKIKKELNQFENVIYQQNDENIGFSKANNNGYRILKEKYDVEFVVFLNNDTVIEQRDFFEKIIQISARDSYAVLGPDVYAPVLKTHQNPLYKEIPSIEDIEHEMARKKEQINDISFTERQYLDNMRKVKIKSNVPFLIFKIRAKLLNKNDFFNYKKAAENPVLMGACLVFTPIYVSNFDSVFMPETKFYFEELILAQRCKALNLKTLYTPELKIIHYHGASTHKASKNLREYILFTINQTLESFSVYKDFYYSLQSKDKL